MKTRTIITCVWLLTSLAYLSSCTTNELDVKITPIEERTIANTSTNEVFDGIAQTISKLLRESGEFRRIVKGAALERFDGDYDIMLKSLGDKALSDISATRGLGATVSVAEIFDEFFPLTKTTTKEDILMALVEQYPLMQISVPFHADTWEEGYIPTVIFLDEEYQENVTKFVKGYDANGDEVWVDAINPPTVPVIVVGFNERQGLSVEEQEGLVYSYLQQTIEKSPNKVVGGNIPQLPIDTIAPGRPGGGIAIVAPLLSITTTNTHILLSWTQAQSQSSIQTTGYRIYRKAAGEANFTLITTNSGATNTTYYDVNYVSSQHYDYYVVAYGRMALYSFTSSSNIVSCVAPVRPDPVESLTLTPLNTTRLMLSWVAPTAFVDSMEIHRLNLLGDDESSHIATIMNPHSALDSYVDNVVPGQKYMYELTNRLSGNYSTTARDIYYAPYRNVHQTEPIYVQRMGYDCGTDEIEGIFQGSPEFYLTIFNPDEEQNVVNAGSSERILFAFDSRTSHSQAFYNRKIMDWLPDPDGWMDKITIHAAEYDFDSDAESNITLSIGANIKVSDAVTVELANATIEYTFSPRKRDYSCGNVYINYFDNPVQTYTFPNYGFYMNLSNIP